MITLESIYEARVELIKKHNLEPNKIYIPYGDLRNNFMREVSTQSKYRLDNEKFNATYESMTILGMETEEQPEFIPRRIPIVWHEGEKEFLELPNRQLYVSQTIIYETIKEV